VVYCYVANENKVEKRQLRNRLCRGQITV